MSAAIPIGESKSHCGYCRQDGDTFVADGLIAYQLAPADYQMLIDQRWRRSGQYVYRPILEATCCQLQTIRYVRGMGKRRLTDLKD